MTTTSTARITGSIDITTGPEADRLWEAARQAYSGDRVTFRGIWDHSRYSFSVVELEMQIIGIQHEDGSGHSFNLVAQVRDVSYGAQIPELGRYTFYYNAHRRTGHLDLTQK